MRRAITGMLILALLCTPLMQAVSTPQLAFAQEITSATTTDALNMRNQASLSAGVILVIPRGASVVVRGSAQSGFLPVTYQGTQGWAHSDYLAVSRPSGSPGQTGTVTESLNLRIGPSTGQRAIMVLPAGATVTVTGSSSNGFLAVTYGGYTGYAHGDWIRTGTTPPPSAPAPTAVPNVPSPTGTGQVTEGLNLRSQANTSSSVILVMPAGATVSLSGRSSGDFLEVTYNNRTGWAHRTWIRTGTTPPPVPAPTAVPSLPSPTGTARVTEALNLRSQANTSSSVILVMPANATISLTGRSSGAFLEVTYNNRTGWAHADWIQIQSPSPGTPAQPTPPAPVPPTPAPTPPPPTPTPVVPAPAPPVTNVKGNGTVIEELNLRSGATTTSAVILVMPAGVTVKLTGEVSGLFYQVEYDGRIGWAHKDWIAISDSTVTPTNTARVTEPVNLRGGPATEYKRILVLPAGAMVTLIGQQSNGFHAVSYNGQTGWAFSTYLNLDQAAQNLPIVPPGSVEPEPELYPPISTNQGFHYTNAIVGPTRGTPEQAIEYAQRAGSLRIDDVELYIYEIYRLAPLLGFDPSLLVAQSALETGYWKSKWWEERLNPAGLGISDDPSTHPYSDSFPNGTIAARAQMAHMHAEVYGNRVALPPILQGIDITYEAVFRAGWAGTVVTLEDLSGTWATDPQYGWKVSRVASYIFG